MRGAREGDSSGALAPHLGPYVPRLVADWLDSEPDRRHRSVHATLLFADISGFTALTERLARFGTLGAEQMSDTLDSTFGALLEVAHSDGADLLKWGGDAVILLFQGDDNAARAARAAHRMRAALRDLVRRRALPVQVNLRMSIGVHSGAFDMFLVGDAASHRELLIAGPAASELVEMERLSDAGQIGLSAATVAMLPQSCCGATILGAPSPGARLLRSSPPLRNQAEAADGPLPADVSGAIPPMIRAHLEDAHGESEHRPVAVAFIGFSGIDALLRQHGALAATTALDQMVGSVQQACLAHGVVFFESDVAHDGGKILLTAGAPRSTGEDSERLLRTVRDIVDRAGVLSLRVGVNRGSVFAGDFGPGFRRTYSVKGDAVNLAARIMAKAAPGEVLASEDVVSRSRTFVRTERVEPFAVKGKAFPVHTLRVLGLVEGRSAARAESPFTGRSEELGRLRATVDRARQRSGSVVDVSGPPGIGKSRLVAELAPLPEDLVVLATTSSNFDSNASYFPFRTLMRDLLGIRPEDDAASVQSRLALRVQDSAPHIVPWLPVLAPLLAIEMPPTPQTRDLDERFRRHRLEEIALELLDAILPTPTLFVFEDVHLIDEASASLLQRLLTSSPLRPWCVIVTRRDASTTFVPDPTLPGLVPISLGPLSDEAATDLIEATAGDAALGVRAIEAMAGRAAGNPLFLTSLAGAAQLDGDAGNLPSSIEGVYLRELDRLDPRSRSLLRYAAVLGVRFEPGLLAALVPDADGADGSIDGRFDGDVEALFDGALAEFVETQGDGTVQFRHSLMRDVAYDGLPFRLRRSMHAQVALLLERDGDPAASPASLSGHFHSAGMHEQTWTHSLVAGEQAAAAYAYSEAADYFGRALDAATHLPELGQEARSAAYIRLGETRDMSGQSTAAIAAFRAARRLLPHDPVGRARLMYREARISLRLGKHPQSLRTLTRALHVIGDLPGAEADGVRAELATRYGFCRHLQGRPDEALRWMTQGARWAESSADTGVLAHAYNALHLAYGASAHGEDKPYGRLALAAYEELGDLGGQALCVNNLAIDDFRAGRWTEAAEMFERAASMFQRLGDEANEGNVTYNLGDVLVSRGRFDEALPPLRRALRLARGVDDEELVALALREGARAHAALGDTDRAWGLFAEARAKLVGLHLPIETALLDAARVEALVATGRIDDGVHLAATAQRQAIAGKVPDVLPRLHRVHAFALLALGRADDATEQVQRGLELVEAIGDGYDKALLGLARAEALGHTDPGSTAEQERLRNGAHATLERLGVVRLVGVSPAAQMPPRTSRTNSTMR
ncbi:adenylate/guanylate cyclase domain-containing protein [Knoellia sp. S7-12]|uniref:tetratricopeptide repeat protein n=1 Tax=Knoellia sp. S7-12 TaxID=3126698 RepID=UPI00336846CD